MKLLISSFMENNDLLETAQSFINYQETLNHQRNFLKEKFQTDCTIAYNGGLFYITAEWLASLDTSFQWVLDINAHPIFINDMEDLKNLATDTYKQALTYYGEEYQKLRRQRSVRSLTDI